MTKLIDLMLAVLIVNAVFSVGIVHAKYGGGTGTAEDPFVISEPGHLDAMRYDSTDPDTHFILTANIDLSGKIYTDSALIGGFGGSFDGGWHVIENLTIELDDNLHNYVGFFGNIASTGLVQNIGLVNVNIIGGKKSRCLGGLAGLNYGTISECYAIGTVICSDPDGGFGTVGGLVGLNIKGVITGSYANVSVTRGGGLVGSNREGIIRGCYATGSVNGGGGGLVGYNNGIIQSCFSTGSVSGGKYVGGLCGHLGNQTMVSNSFWDVESSGQTTSLEGEGKTTVEMQQLETFLGWGGDDVWVFEDGSYPRLAWEDTGWDVIGHYDYTPGSGTKEDPYRISTGEQFRWIGKTRFDWDKYFVLENDISVGAFHVNELVGEFSGVFDGRGYEIFDFTVDSGGRSIGMFRKMSSLGTVKNLILSDISVSEGWVKWGYNTGGIVGLNYGTISNCIVSGYVEGMNEHTGGIVGYNSGTISGCYSACVVEGRQYVGGVAGSTDWRGKITSCSSAGAVSGLYYIGGLTGFNSNSVISSCFSTGTVSGSRKVGGLSGGNSGELTSCFATGVVTGSEEVGGLLGYNIYSEVKFCYATGSVTGESSVGGLIGMTGGLVVGCYSTGLVTGSEYVGGLIGNVRDFIDSTSRMVSNSFWDIDSSGQMSSCGGQGKTTTEMQLLETFLGWGGENVWAFENGSYPGLAWENTGWDLIGRHDYAPGSGTEDDPYRISTGEQFRWIGKTSSDWDKHFVLENDISLGLCHINELVAEFGGVFDGSHHVIRDFTVDSEEFYTGLFRKVCPNGIVRRVNLVNCTVSGVYAFVGGLAGFNGGLISSCSVNGSFTGREFVGGLVGFNHSDFQIPGIDNGAINYSYASGTVTGYECVGGLTGGPSGTIASSYATCSVTGDTEVGGLSGRGRKVTNCYACGPVTGNSQVNGLLGDRFGMRQIVKGPNETQGPLVSFWDVQVSGVSSSGVGEGRTTIEMQSISTFLDAGWDFVGESANGTDDIWFIREGSYPQLWWENTPPIADAGEDQVVYAGFVGLVEAVLDGSGSSDEDEDELEYVWSWEIGGEVFEASGAGPVVELPVGVHEIKLVVNDGIEDSEPDTVQVEVVGAIEADFLFVPQVINSQSKGRYVMGMLLLSEGIKTVDVDLDESFVIYPGGVDAFSQRVINGRGNSRILVLFRKTEVIDGLDGAGKVEVTLIGKLKSGRFLYGSDTVRVTGSNANRAKRGRRKRSDQASDKIKDRYGNNALKRRG